MVSVWLNTLSIYLSFFLKLLDDARFGDVEKIKTISSTYMAASGLASGLNNDENEEDEDCQKNTCKPLLDLVDFALALKGRLDNINQESFNDFVLRVGKSNQVKLAFDGRNLSFLVAASLLQACYLAVIKPRSGCFKSLAPA